jgi:hypothetical protein
VGNCDGIGLGRESSQLHDHNGGRRGSNGHHSVHDNAQLAVVGVRLVRVQVRDLSNDQHRQQNQTKGGDGRQKAGPDAAFTAEICLKSCQSMEPSSSILQIEPTDLDALGLERMHLSYDFDAVREPTQAWQVRLN